MFRYFLRHLFSHHLPTPPSHSLGHQKVFSFALPTPSVAEISRPLPESIFSLFKSHHFTDAQIAHLFSRFPMLFHPDVDRTLDLNLRSLSKSGFGQSRLNELVLLDPRFLLQQGIDKQLKPFLDLLGSIVGSEEKILTVIRKDVSMLTMMERMKRGITCLMERQVPAAHISNLLLNGSELLRRNPLHSAAILERMKSFGIGPENPSFLCAFRAWNNFSKMNLERKSELFEKLGWSHEEFVFAVRQGPLFLSTPLKAIRMLIDLLASDIKFSLHPNDSRVLRLQNSGISMKIIRRLMVFQVLKENGLIEQNQTDKLIVELFVIDKVFEERYLRSYDEQVPELNAVYSGERERKRRKKEKRLSKERNSEQIEQDRVVVADQQPGLQEVSVSCKATTELLSGGRQ